MIKSSNIDDSDGSGRKAKGGRERRRFLRARYLESLDFREEKSGMEGTGMGIDVSAGGMSFFSGQLHHLFNAVELILLNRAVSVRGVVRNIEQIADGGKRVGVEFVHVEHELFDVLRDIEPCPD